MDLRSKIKSLINSAGLSIRKLSQISGVRRPSIMNFLSGGNIHIDNLQKILNALGYDLYLDKKGLETNRELLFKRLGVSAKEIKVFCKKNHIVSMAFFGSILRNDFNKESDIDIIIDTKETITLFDLIELEEKIKKLLKTRKKIDLLTKNSISPLIKDEIEKDLEVVYDKAA